MSTSLRSRRTAARLSQSELAQRVGVSRQALHAIEAGRQVPSTLLALQLARVLRCHVEDLFGLGTAQALVTTAASSIAHGNRVAVAMVDGRWVAHPVFDPSRSVDGLAVGGDAKTVEVEPLVDRESLERNVLVAGCAPLLGLFAGRIDRGEPSARATWLSAHSGRALELLERGLVHVAGIHLTHGSDASDHASLVRRRFPDAKTTIINLTRWTEGLVVAPGNPLGLRGVTDLLRPDVRVAQREPGAGARALLETLVGDDAHNVVSGPMAASHAEVANMVRWDVADVGVAIESTAIQQGLEFIPLSEERFDLLVPHHRLEARAVRRALDALGTSSFRTEASHVPGYDLSSSGHVSTVEPIP